MKTAEELKVTQEELDALLWTREMLATSKVEHVCQYKPACVHAIGNVFNMDFPFDYSSCGSAGCIAGWMAIKLCSIKPTKKGVYIGTEKAKERAKELCWDHGGPIHRLFVPRDAASFDWLTTDHAVHAINTFLETGKAEWPARVTTGGMND